MIAVDDRFAMSADGTGKLINARPSKNSAWWLVILEKAYAKYYGFYANLDGGSPVQAFRDLTGKPVLRQLIDDVTDD